MSSFFPLFGIWEGKMKQRKSCKKWQVRFAKNLTKIKTRKKYEGIEEKRKHVSKVHSSKKMKARKKWMYVNHVKNEAM